MIRVTALLVVAMGICLSGALSLAQSSTETAVPEFIGSARMLPDGTIYADLIAISPDGKTVGERRFIIEPSNSRYEEWKVHLGGISPGEEKPVPPFPPKSEEPE